MVVVVAHRMLSLRGPLVVLLVVVLVVVVLVVVVWLEQEEEEEVLVISYGVSHLRPSQQPWQLQSKTLRLPELRC